MEQTTQNQAPQQNQQPGDWPPPPTPPEYPLTPEKNHQSDLAHGLAIASLALGIASFVFFCCCCCFYIIGPMISIFCALLSIVFGVISMKQNAAHQAMCIAGMICALISILLAAFILGTCLGLGGGFFKDLYENHYFY